MPMHPPRRAYPHALFAAFLLAAAPSPSFVILDTSDPDRVPALAAPSVPVANPDSQAAIPAPPQGAASRPGEPARYRNVLYLSADSKLVYAYIGVFKALEEYGLAPDAVLAESKAVWVGAAWAVGYDAAGMERFLARRPLEALLSPFPAKRPLEERTFIPDGRDPLQWDVPISLQALQSRAPKWTEVAADDPGEFLHLSWAIAQMTHDAPGGPVEELEAAPRRLAVQVSDLESSQGAVRTEGSLQNILKGSLLPAEAVRRRASLWPYASGSLLSGHGIMADKLPFACDRIIIVQPGRRLRPPALETGPLPWTDSLALRSKQNAANQNAEAAPASLSAKALRIELDPGPAFDPEEKDPSLWIELGYTSTLRSMDVLKSALAAAEPRARAAADSAEGMLSLNRLSVNPLAPGGRQLLLDIIRISEDEATDSGGEASIAALVASGFYRDLDVEWARGSEQEKALLVFDAREKSKVRFQSGWNAAIGGEDIVDRPPEIYGGLAWSEPFYIPFDAEAGALLGGHRPGYQWRLMIAPIFPVRMDLGLAWSFWQIHYPYPQAKQTESLAPLPMRFQRDVWQFFLNLYPSTHAWSKSSVQANRVVFPGNGEPDDTLKSLDFRETAYLGLGKPIPGGGHMLSWRCRVGYMYQINLQGQPRDPFTGVESRLRLALGDFRLMDQYFWSDQANQDLTAFDVIRAGRIEALSFQDEYFFRDLRSSGFRNARAEYCPTWGRGGLMLAAGAWRNYGPTLFESQLEEHDIFGTKLPGHAYWEAQAGYATPLGSLRMGMGGLSGEAPFYFVRMGSSLGLGFGEGDF